jgi:glycosyltransferase involved in cell wall biosynthesis
MPKVSFVMPNRNKAVYITEAINTILSQTLEDIELIIIDDDSTDDSRDIIDYYVNKDKRVRKIYLDPVDLPVAERIDRARNIGNKEAKSDIICVQDSDDWNFPKRAEITYETLTPKKECDLFFSSYYQRDRFGKVDERIPNYLPAVEFSVRRLKETGFFFIGHLTVGYRKETILSHPYNSDAGVGDWGMLYSLLIKAGVKSCYSEEPLCIYRVYNNALKNLHDEKFNQYLFDKKQKKMELMGELKNILSV